MNLRPHNLLIITRQIHTDHHGFEASDRSTRRAKPPRVRRR
jgi:hypothetical protein